MTDEQLLKELCKASAEIAEVFRLEASGRGADVIGFALREQVAHLASLAPRYAQLLDERALAVSKTRRSMAAATVNNVIAFPKVVELPQPASDDLDRRRSRFWRHPNDRPFLEPAVGDDFPDDIPF